VIDQGFSLERPGTGLRRPLVLEEHAGRAQLLEDLAGRGVPEEGGHAPAHHRADPRDLAEPLRAGRGQVVEPGKGAGQHLRHRLPHVADPQRVDEPPEGAVLRGFDRRRQVLFTQSPQSIS
jgi:hypothetical protein